MTIKQSALPYDQDALEPHISAKTLSFHYDKHHRGYINKLNKAIDDTSYAAMGLDEIVSTARRKSDVGVFNNAAQAWNHAFLWESMSPNGGAQPVGRVKEMIESDFGDLDRFKKDFKSAALSQFGSGWVWLVQDAAQLRIITTGNADTPLGTSMRPLLTLDVWEHAYYLDYQNERNRYIDAFLNNLINWKFAAANLVSADKLTAA